MIAAQCLGLPSSEIAAFAGRDEGPAHEIFRAFFVAEARRNRVCMHKTSGEISAGYERRARAAARFAAQHHQMARRDARAAQVRRLSEQHVPADERRGVFPAVVR